LDLMKNLLPKILNFFKELTYFISSRVFLKNFAIAMLLVFAIGFLAFTTLNFYTRNGQAIELPDYREQSLADAKEMLARDGFRYQLVDSMYHPNKAPLTVLDQDPNPKAKVKKNRKVYLTINASTPPLINLPDIWGKDLKFVKRICKARGFNVAKKIEYQPDRAKNTVLKVKHNGEEIKQPNKSKKDPPIRLPKGSEISLVVARASGYYVAIPNVKCQTLDEAEFTIRNYGLKVGKIIVEGELMDTTAAYIYRQSPNFKDKGTMLSGQPLRLWISKERKEECL